MRRDLDANNLSDAEDWAGNNIAVACPVCSKVYIVSQLIHRGERQCPRCSKSKGFVTGGKDSGGAAWVTWPH